MKMLTIMPAREKPEKVTAEEWAAIKKGGERTLPSVTAREAIKNSRGGYIQKPEAMAVEIQTGIDLNIQRMSNEQLKTIVLAAGKRIGKKKIKRTELEKLAQRCITETVEVDDGDVEGDMDERRAELDEMTIDELGPMVEGEDVRAPGNKPEMIEAILKKEGYEA